MSCKGHLAVNCSTKLQDHSLELEISEKIASEGIVGVLVDSCLPSSSQQAQRLGTAMNFCNYIIGAITSTSPNLIGFYPCNVYAVIT